MRVLFSFTSLARRAIIYLLLVLFSGHSMAVGANNQIDQETLGVWKANLDCKKRYSNETYELTLDLGQNSTGYQASLYWIQKKNGNYRDSGNLEFDKVYRSNEYFAMSIGTPPYRYFRFVGRFDKQSEEIIGIIEYFVNCGGRTVRFRKSQ